MLLWIMLQNGKKNQQHEFYYIKPTTYESKLSGRTIIYDLRICALDGSLSCNMKLPN
jgi:hypothetical protein